MPVLKQHHNAPAMREAIVLDLGDIGAQAERIRVAAESQAAKIIAAAKQQSESVADELYAEAHKQGHDEGLEKGLLEGREQGRAEALAESAEQLGQLTAAWSQVATDWEQQCTEMEREARQAVLEFALAAAEKIVHRVIEVDESVVVDQAAQALSLVLSAHEASVCIHPVDRPMLEAAMPELLKELVSLEHIDLVDDEAITPGGCMVSFGQGRIDATIERQLQRLIDLMLPEPPPIEMEPEPDVPDVENAVPAPEAAESAEVPQLADPVGPAPVYEITDQGLVQSQGGLVDEVVKPDTEAPEDISLGNVAEQADQTEQEEPESEA